MYNIFSETDYFIWEEPGILKYLVYFAASGILFALLLIALDSRLFANCWYTVKPNSMKSYRSYSKPDDDVSNEKNMVWKLSNNEILNYAVVIRDLSKYYRKLLAVDR